MTSDSANTPRHEIDVDSLMRRSQPCWRSSCDSGGCASDSRRIRFNGRPMTYCGVVAMLFAACWPYRGRPETSSPISARRTTTWLSPSGHGPCPDGGLISPYYYSTFLYITGIEHIEVEVDPGKRIVKLQFPRHRHGAGDGMRTVLRQSRPAPLAAGTLAALCHAFRTRAASRWAILGLGAHPLRRRNAGCGLNLVRPLLDAARRVAPRRSEAARATY